MRLVASTLVVALALTSACTHAADRGEGYGTRAPRQQPKVEQVPVKGYKTRIRFDDGERLSGELLVAEPDGVVIIRTRKHGDQTRQTASIERARVITDPAVGAWLGGIGGGSVLFVSLTLASGWYFIYLMPIVAAGGAIALGIVWAESRVILTDDELQYLYQYARWPQGRPISP